jgi:hypothetical protein
VRRRRCLALAYWLAPRVAGDMVGSGVPGGALRVTRSQDCRLAGVDPVRETSARPAWPMPTPSSGRRIGFGRGGDDR